jgi:transcriptional regulator with XRE-family HTH domain
VSKTKINVPALFAALDGRRKSNGSSWRQLAKEIGVSPSLLSRLGNGNNPDAEGFVTLVRWLKLPAEDFMTTEGGATSQEQPDLMSQLAPLLRARRDLDDADVAYLEEVIQATVRRAKAGRQD